MSMNPDAHHVFMHRIDSKSDVDVQKVPCSNLHFYSPLLAGLHLRRRVTNRTRAA